MRIWMGLNTVMPVEQSFLLEYQQNLQPLPLRLLQLSHQNLRLRLKRVHLLKRLSL